ncbi:MAG: ATP-binding protein [Spirochaetes bacterium]|nr:ATP-binding protein [Spirochaetota bacterium]MBN2771241.1 ATP-binding protein [Spirochaetota bacterium]
MVKTANVTKADKFIQHTIGRNGLGCIVGEKGTGKTFVKRKIIGKYQEKSSFKVVEITPIDDNVKNITQIMAAMIDDISGEPIRRDSESRRRQLRRVLGDSSQNYTIILAIDEAQDLHKSTIRGIKKLHELGWGTHDKLFTVLFFGQPSFETKINDDELGPRIRKIKMQPLTKAEKGLFVPDKTVFTSKAYEQFIRRVKPTPLCIEQDYEQLLSLAQDLDLDQIDEQMLSDYYSIDIRQHLRSFGMSTRQMQKDIEETTGERVSVTALSQYKNGKYAGDNNKMDVLMQRYIHQKVCASV